MAEARSQQAASMTEFHWLGHRFPISNAKTRVSILKGLLLIYVVIYFKQLHKGNFLWGDEVSSFYTIYVLF